MKRDNQDHRRVDGEVHAGEIDLGKDFAV